MPSLASVRGGAAVAAAAAVAEAGVSAPIRLLPEPLRGGGRPGRHSTRGDGAGEVNGQRMRSDCGCRGLHPGGGPGN